ncbi:MAG: SPOR domain-containing protein [Chromatiaceae bacterium]|jgi:septal ring-binding cell division protein DamX
MQASAHADYFDTPARAERLQLLQHLLRNVGEVIYLRAPAGAGKTLFAHRLLETLREEMAVVWVRAGVDRDLTGIAMDQLGLASGATLQWPDDVLAALGGQDLLLVVDDVELLDLEAVYGLVSLHAQGGRLLLIGNGGLAKAKGVWDVQFVDLPAFDPEQTAAFLRSRREARGEAVTDAMVTALHNTSRGLPGPLLKGLTEILDATRRRRASAGGKSTPAGQRPARRLIGRPFWAWVAGAAAAVVLGVVLVFQDDINGRLEGPLVSDPVVPAAAQDARQEQLTGPSRITAAGSTPAPLKREAPGQAVDGAVASLIPPMPDFSERGDPPRLAAADGPVAATQQDALDAVMRDAFAAAVDGERSPEPAPATTETAPVVAASGVVNGPSDTMAGPEAQPAPPMEQPAESAAAESGPASPSGSVPARAEQPPVAALPEKAASPRSPAATAAQPPTGAVGMQWLTSREPGHYTLQLVGARDRAAVERYARDQGIASPHAIFERELDGRPWYSLVAGDYPDRTAALAARARLPAGIDRAKVWARTFESIKKSL